MDTRLPLTESDLAYMRLPEGFWTASIAQSTLSCLPRLERYVGRLAEVREEGYGLILWGNNGRGKSAAAAAILKEAVRQGYGGLWCTAQQVCDWTIQRTMYTPLQSCINRLSEVDFAVIDDLGKEHRDDKGWSIRVMERLIRDRSAAKRCTIVTTNLTRLQEQIPSLYKPSMFEVMKERMVPLKCDGVDRRVASMKTASQFLEGGDG